MGERHIPIALPATGEDEWQAVREPIMSGWLTQGLKVLEFEKQFAKRHKVANAIAIPLHNRMAKEDYEYIVATFHEL